MNTPPDDFDERAREAGRALRQAAPADGLARINRARRNRRLAQAGGALAVAVLAAGGVVALVNRGGDDVIVTTDPTTIPTTVPTTVAPTDPVQPVTTTDPALVPPTGPVTNPTTTTPPSTVPESPGGPSVWVGHKLAGWYADGAFVPYAFDGVWPDGLLGGELTLTGTAGSTHTATVTDEDCSSPYLTPRPDDWAAWATADAPVTPIAFEASANPAELDAALTAAGADPAAGHSVAVPVTGDGSSDQPRLVMVDGWNDTFQFPTWIAVWDGGELTTIEGDPDPSNALDIGMPLDAFYDLDGDGAWEVVFAVGDGWGVFEVTTGDTLVFGDAHPCPEPGLEPPATAAALIGEWSLDPGGEPALLIDNDGLDTYARYGYCQDTVVGADGTFSVVSSGACPGDEADPRLAGLAGATLTRDAAGRLFAQPPEGEAFELHRLPESTGLDLERGSLAGVRAGEIGPVDELIGRISAELGEPDLDTGWFTTPTNPNPDSPDCLAGMDTRTLWWGDLAVSLWPLDERGLAGYVELWNFTLGARPGAVNLPAGTQYTPAPSGLVSNQGVAVGTPQAVADEAFGERLRWSDDGDGPVWGALTGRPSQYGGNYVEIVTDRQSITQLSATRTFC